MGVRPRVARASIKEVRRDASEVTTHYQGNQSKQRGEPGSICSAESGKLVHLHGAERAWLCEAHITRFHVAQPCLRLEGPFKKSLADSKTLHDQFLGRVEAKSASKAGEPRRISREGGRRKHRPMGQRVAKQQMLAGVRLYHQRHHQQAVSKWTQALSTLQNPEDRFITLGYLAQAYCDSGDCEATLHYALLQMQLASERNDEYMKSEGFLNLAKAYERLADYSKALSYGKASLQHPSMDPRTPGYAHLGYNILTTFLKRKTIALAHLGLSQFQASLEACEQAMNVSIATEDRLLELQVCVVLGTLFTLLRDLTKALIFLRNALAVVQTVTIEDVHAKYRALALLHLSIALRMRGSLVEAKEACDEALRLSSECGHRTLHARCLCSLADIYRELGESEAKETITKSWARYEEAFRIMRSAADRQGEMLVLASMAKSASESRSHYTGQCECQAISLNKKCLEIARIIGCKHAMLKCHLRLADLYAQLNDDDSEEVARKAISSLTQEMELFCNFCGHRYATKDESLQALRCSHIFHEKCLQVFLRERSDQSCPKCRCRAFLSDTISQRTPSICSMDIEPNTSWRFSNTNTGYVPAGAVRTPLVNAHPTPIHYSTPRVHSDADQVPSTSSTGIVVPNVIHETATVKRNLKGSSQSYANHTGENHSGSNAREESNERGHRDFHVLPPAPPPITTTAPVDDDMTAEIAQSLERLDHAIHKSVMEQRKNANCIASSSSAGPATMFTSQNYGPTGTLTKKPPPPPPPRKPKLSCCSQEGLAAIETIMSLPPPLPLSENGPLVISRAPTITDV